MLNQTDKRDKCYRGCWGDLWTDARHGVWHLEQQIVVPLTIEHGVARTWQRNDKHAVELFENWL